MSDLEGLSRDALKGRIQELERALEPFSQMRLAQPEKEDDAIALLGIRGDRSIRNGDIRRARDAMAWSR